MVGNLYHYRYFSVGDKHPIIHYSACPFYILFRFSSGKLEAAGLQLCCCFLGCLPWLIYVYIHKDQIVNALSWQTNPSWVMRNVFILIDYHLKGMSQIFINFEALNIDNLFPGFLKRFLALFMIGGFLYLFRKVEKKLTWFITLISLSGVVVIIAIDLIRPSIVSWLIRYQLLNYAGIILLISFAFKHLQEKKPLVFTLFFFPLIFTGILSSKLISDDPCFHKRFDAYDHVDNAKKYFSEDERILLLSDYHNIGFTSFISILIRSKNNNIDVLYCKSEYPDFRKILKMRNYDKVYAFHLSDNFRTHLQSVFSKEELLILKDRKLYNGYYTPLYQIDMQPTSLEIGK